MTTFHYWFSDTSSNAAHYNLYAPKEVIAKAPYRLMYFEEAKKFGPHVVGIFERNGLLINDTINTVKPCWNENEEYWANPCIQLDYKININNTNIILEINTSY
jgi:hypothetical protein